MAALLDVTLTAMSLLLFATVFRVVMDIYNRVLYVWMIVVKISISQIIQVGQTMKVVIGSVILDISCPGRIVLDVRSIPTSVMMNQVYGWI
jgi:hypothetical protein